MGEITTDCYVDIPYITRETIREIGYTRAKYGFDCDTCAVITTINEQSPDIAMGVNEAYEVRDTSNEVDEVDKIGAGDQGMMFGYAVNETPELMPLPISLAHKLARRLAQVRKTRVLPFLRPDGKTQVTVQYEDSKPVRVDKVVVSAQHKPSTDLLTLKEGIIEEVVKKVIPEQFLDKNTQFFVNPTGRFVIGGPHGDSGLTGRKIIVDTYGGFGRHGGGALSGKDPTKVDRSGAYAARYVAKNIIAAGLASRCEVQVAYAIGVAKPVSIMVDTFGTGILPDEKIEKLVRDNFDLRPGAIIRDLDLLRPIYKLVSCYGHFGREELALPWERVDKAEILKNQASSL
jgi:S-adenosylmethionine synthetase